MSHVPLLLPTFVSKYVIFIACVLILIIFLFSLFQAQARFGSDFTYPVGVEVNFHFSAALTRTKCIPTQRDFLSDPIYGTLVDEDTNSIPTDEVKMAILAT